ncbi:MAG TPA: carbohydrate kinase family protein [Desulfotomaculum sp.]|nr:carbohydrate kinase family protein [Desulfotomaculum sp.]
MFLGCGALNVDYLYAVDALVADGETFCDPVGREPGGSAANTTFLLAKLGVPCRFVGVVGEDADGRSVLQSLAAGGVDTATVVSRSGHSTGRAFCFIDKHGHRALYVSPGANLTVTAADLRRGLDAGVSWVHCSSFAGDAPFSGQLAIIAALAPEVRLSLAPGALYAARGYEALLPVLVRCTALFLSAQELRTLTGEPEIATGARMVLTAGVKAVAVTVGKEGSLVFTPSSRLELPALPVKVVDTTGAGDAFAAGFIFGCLNDWALADAQRFAHVVASFIVGGWGARGCAPSLLEAKERYEHAYQAALPPTRSFS